MSRRRVAFLSDENIAPRVVQALRSRGFDVYDIEDLFRVRVGDYQIVYQVRRDRLLVLVVRVGHHKEI